ncbi:MAG: hypothetical protein NCW75_13810 [Phycisphaera sp.]|nr:MAG: hypothetical protein NCW75_13810 [Phycisphaera sp.]
MAATVLNPAVRIAISAPLIAAAFSIGVFVARNAGWIETPSFADDGNTFMAWKTGVIGDAQTIWRIAVHGLIPAVLIDWLWWRKKEDWKAFLSLLALVLAGAMIIIVASAIFPKSPLPRILQRLMPSALIDSARLPAPDVSKTAGTFIDLVRDGHITAADTLTSDEARTSPLQLALLAHVLTDYPGEVSFINASGGYARCRVTLGLGDCELDFDLERHARMWLVHDWYARSEFE